MINQINIAGKWMDGEPTVDGQIYRIKIPVGKGFGYQQQRYSTATETIKKLVGMGDLGELLPDAVLVELEDFKNTKSTTPAKRQAATRILTRINSNIKVDVLNSEFEDLLTKLVTHTSLTGSQAVAILDTLKGI